jgi:MFS family permease
MLSVLLFPTFAGILLSGIARTSTQRTNLNIFNSTTPPMEKTSEKTSTWLALRNPVFRRLWLAMVVSGSCIGAHNTAVYWALHSLGAKIVLISLMATVSALPSTLSTLPAGAIADMVDRKKILLAVQLWHASIAIALPILWMAHLLNPYLILASAFLFSLGFAFSSPAHSSVIAEMVSAEELGSAYTLAGMQMDLSGIIGPLLSALLLPKRIPTVLECHQELLL